MLELTAEERAMAEGREGPAVRRAMEIVLALAKIYGAESLVPVTHVQIAGVSYKNLGDAGLDFLRNWAQEGARARVPATMNPAGMDMEHWGALGIPADFARKQEMVVNTYAAMGIEPTLTCTPYMVGYRPQYGEHLAWSESSAVSMSNSVLGARTNREGGPSALAAAITGRTAKYGYHLDRSRMASHLIRVHWPVESEVDFGALGYLVGRQVQGGVPYFRFMQHDKLSQLTSHQREDRLKTLGAAMAASGAVALYHVEGVTPDALRHPMLGADPVLIEIESLADAFEALNDSPEPIDFVSIGCPHASLAEIREVAEMVRGKRLSIPLWITAARPIRTLATEEGLTQAIEAAGGRVVSDTCVVVAPVDLLGFRRIATNSAKAAFYLPSHSGASVHFGSLAQCVAAAIRGRWA